MKYGNRPPWKRFIASPLTLIALLIILIILARATAKLNAKAATGETRLAQAQAEYTKLQQRQTDLSEKVGRLSTEEGLESEIRAKYRAVKNGESVAVIIDDNAAAAVQATTTAQIGWFKRLLRKFGL